MVPSKHSPLSNKSEAPYEGLGSPRLNELISRHLSDLRVLTWSTPKRGVVARKVLELIVSFLLFGGLFLALFSTYANGEFISVSGALIWLIVMVVSITLAKVLEVVVRRFAKSSSLPLHDYFVVYIGMWAYLVLAHFCHVGPLVLFSLTKVTYSFYDDYRFSLVLGILVAVLGVFISLAFLIDVPPKRIGRALLLRGALFVVVVAALVAVDNMSFPYGSGTRGSHFLAAEVLTTILGIVIGYWAFYPWVRTGVRWSWFVRLFFLSEIAFLVFLQFLAPDLDGELRPALTFFVINVPSEVLVFAVGLLPLLPWLCFNLLRYQYRNNFRGSFYRSLAMAVESGYPTASALDILMRSPGAGIFQAQLREIKLALERGVAFDEALSRAPSLAPVEDVAFLSGALKSETLQEALNFLAEKHSLRAGGDSGKTWTRALFLESVAVLCMASFVFVVAENKFREIYSALFGEGFRSFAMHAVSVGYYMICLCFACSVVLILAPWFSTHLYSRVTGSLAWVLEYLLFPFRHFLWLRALSQFAYSLSVQLEHGVALLPAFRHAIDASGAPVLVSRRERLLVSLMEGKALHEVFRASSQIPSWVGTDLALGADSDNLPQMLRLLSKRYVLRTVYLKNLFLTALCIMQTIFLIIATGLLVTGVYFLIFELSKIPEVQ
jgi:type II secretory pathway component PulF